MDLRDKPELAFPWGEPAPDPGFQGANRQESRICRYKTRLLCDPTVKPFVCAYTSGRPIWKDSWDATAQWLFVVQEGRVTAINRDETARDDQVQPMLVVLKKLIPSLEGYATSGTNDYWVVTYSGVKRGRYTPDLQDCAKREWVAKRKRPRFHDSDQEEDE